jgi:negative regulator of flagellin synthesis FlgM
LYASHLSGKSALKNKKTTPPATASSKPATRTRTVKSQNESESNLAKIKAVKHAIDDGSFKVNAEVVADQIIEATRQNLRRHIKKISH